MNRADCLNVNLITREHMQHKGLDTNLSVILANKSKY